MLLHSFIEDTEIEELGVTDVEAHPDLPTYTKQRANASIYLACQFMLTTGHRELMPLTWAWTKTLAEDYMATWKPDDAEPSIDIDRAVVFARMLVDCIIDNKLPTVVSSVTDSSRKNLNLAVVLNKIASNGMKFKSGFTEGDPIAYIAEKLNIDEDSLATISFASARAFAALQTAMLCQDAAKEPDKPTPDMSKARNMVGAATGRLVMMLGPDYGHYPPLIVEAFETLGDKDDMASVWEAFVAALFSYKEDFELDDPSPIRDDIQRRDYRWRNGHISGAEEHRRDKANAMTFDMAYRETIKNMPPVFSADLVHTIFQFGEGTIDERMKADRYGVFSFLTPEQFDRFRETGKIETIWERAERDPDSLTSEFTDDLLHNRARHDRRLWGEKGLDVTYATYIRRDDKKAFQELARANGPVVIEWSPEVLKWSTVTLNAAHTAPFTLPATKENIRKALLPLTVAQESENHTELGPNTPGIVPIVSFALFGVPAWVKFIEIQVHSALTPDEMEQHRILTIEGE